MIKLNKIEIRNTNNSTYNKPPNQSSQQIMSIPTRITMSHLLHVIKSAGKNTHPPLGRWARHKDMGRGLVVDYSNEDHCGTCGDYINSKLPEPSSPSNVSNSIINNHKNESFHSYDYNNNILEAEYSHMVVNTPN